MNKIIDIIAGARPNFVKIAAIIDAIKESRRRGGGLGYRLIHTGQHHDDNMSCKFFRQLNIPRPDIKLDIEPGTQSEQAASIMTRYEKVLQEQRSDLCMVVGDVTSTMACSIVASKLCVPVAHVEAGIRSGDWTMPEEINRVVTDSISKWFFTTSESANQNLRRAGIDSKRIFFVGNTMIDMLLKYIDRLRPPNFWGDLNLKVKKYLVLTLHRPANVDSCENLVSLLQTISESAADMLIVFPMHPRTAKIMKGQKLVAPNIYFVEPLGYLEFNFLVKNAKAVITDSGGVSEETTVMGVPCMTLRNNTERPETITIGTNELIGANPKNILPALNRLRKGEWKKGAIPDKWDGKAAGRIIIELEKLLIQPSAKNYN
jgi:UDP-N-acetylglucosamine 2-epimerase (non-hydrolysing)